MHPKLFELLGRQPRMGHQGRGHGGRHRFAMAAVEQRITEFCLQIGDAHADRRWHLAKGTGSRRKRAAFDHGQEQLDTVAGKTHRITYQQT
ncbi:hypothetical protein D3C78_797270 [compost metagenome]